MYCERRAASSRLPHTPSTLRRTFLLVLAALVAGLALLALEEGLLLEAFF